MAISESLKAKMREVVDWIHNLFWICAIYGLAELLIWGISRALAPFSVQFFASSVGMMIVFGVMTFIYLCQSKLDTFYNRHIKLKVDFVNSHLGVAFPIPLIMLDRSSMLDGREIACVMANFVVTNVFSWSMAFCLSLAMWKVFISFRSRVQNTCRQMKAAPEVAEKPPQVIVTFVPNPLEESEEGSIHSSRASCDKNQQTPISGIPELEQAIDNATESESNSSQCSSTSYNNSSPLWSFFRVTYPVIVSFCGIFILGIPIAAATRDDRILDACVLWFTWISSLRLQQTIKAHASRSSHNHSRSRGMLATLMNPVLLTTLLMTAYTRAKASALMRSMGLQVVLSTFSGGTPLYALWTAAVEGNVVPGNPSLWFGAGDAALSLLEVGIIVWGFKLYECRRQLFSAAGLLAIWVSAVAAAGNVYLSVLSGRAIGLGTPEALAFAARSTTLALAKPAIAAVGGNTAVNAALVVGNGILGQLLYPFLLQKLEVDDGTELERTQKSKRGGSRQALLRARNYTQDEENAEARCVHLLPKDDDDAVAIATGIAVGINGAAMGVAYLYERKSCAAPYAALSMTVFGVLTVLFTTVGPLKDVVITLASR